MIPSWASDVRFRQRKSAAYLVRGSEAYQLNDVGGFIWTLCDGEHGVEDIATQMAQRFGITHEVARHDAEEFVQSLLNLDLLKVE